MQIQGISSMGGMQPMQPPSDPLTEEQQSTLEEILAEYDMENITQDELDEIHSQMDEAGIPRSRESMEIMTAAGLDFSQMAPPEGQPPAPPSDSSAVTDITSAATVEGQSLIELISQLQTGEASEDDVQAYVDQLKMAISSSVGNMIDQYI